MEEEYKTYLQCEFCFHKWSIPFTEGAEIICPNCGEVGLRNKLLKPKQEPAWFKE